MTAPMPPSASDFLLGSGAKGKSASFPQIGATVTGTICREAEVKQQRDDDGNLDTWPNGDPKWQIVVSLQTDQRNPEIPDDDGVRFLYIKGSKDPASQSMHAAIAGAVGKAGATQLEVGGQLTVTYVADGVKPSPTKNAPKKYTATYLPAAAAALGVPQQQAQPATQPAAVPQQQVPAHQPAAAGVDPELAAVVAHLPELQRNAIISAPGMTAPMAAAMVAAMTPQSA